jgi:hypothetical protein
VDAGYSSTLVANTDLSNGAGLEAAGVLHGAAAASCAPGHFAGPSSNGGW